MRHRSLLARHPGLALTFATAAFVTTMPAAAAAPFVSAVRSATLQHSINQACPWDLGATRLIANPDRAALEQATAPHEVDRLGPPVRTMSTELTAHTSRRPQQPTRLTLLARDGFADHVTVRSGPSGRGLWLPAGYADANGLAVGDTVTLAGTSAMTVQVAAVYTDLHDPYWCSCRDRSGPVVLVDWEDMLEISALQPDGSELAVEHAVLDADRLTQPEAVATARRIAASDARSTLMQEAERADATRRAVVGSIVPLTIAAVLVGLAVLATATRRAARRPAAAMERAAVRRAAVFAVEVFPALAAGVFGGAVSAYALVHALGPSRLVSAEAAPLTLLAAGSVLLGAVAVTGLAGLVRGRAPRYWGVVPLIAAYPVWRATHALILVPLLLVAGLAPLLTGLARRALAGTREARNSVGSLLAWRRLSSQAGSWAILAVAIALPTALVAYADAALATEPFRYAFGYLAGLGLLTAVIVVVMLLWYVESRVTERRRVFRLLRRMGLHRRTHLRATGVELGVPLFAGLAGGLSLAAAFARLLAGVPLRLGTVAVVIALVTAIAVGVAGYAHQRVAR